MLGLTFLIASVCVCIGFSAAVCLNRRSRRSEASGYGQVVPQITNVSADSVLIRELLESLHDVTATVDNNVDQHVSQVTEITDELQLNGSDSSALVLDAAARLVEANRQLRSELHSARAEVNSQQRQLQAYFSEARTDELTGIPNRRAFEEQIQRLLVQQESTGTLFSLGLIDVDHFKRVNDYHGHQVGDAVLKSLADVMNSTLREVDIPARYGGEEFAVILPETTLEEAKRAAERLRTGVDEHTLRLEGVELSISISVGVAQASGTDKRSELVGRADAALYAAKQAGRNRTYCHDGTTCQAVRPSFAAT